MGISIFGGEKMKKILLVSALVLVIATSMVSGTLAVYTHKIDINGAGSVMAKNFILKGEDFQSFDMDVPIAPNEHPEFTFTVSNFDATTTPQTTSEVAMNLLISIDLAGSGIKTAIPPLEVVVSDENGPLTPAGGSINPLGTGTLTFSDDLTNTTDGETKEYTVKITWKDSGDDNEIDYGYASHDFGTALTVSVTGTQQ